jgi:acetyltransferase-like isoleucine patch superfamily enzyme
MTTPTHSLAIQAEKSYDSGDSRARIPNAVMPRAVRLLVQCLLFALPWFLRRRLLRLIFGYRIDPTSKVGFSLIDVGELRIGPQSRIEHFSVVLGLDRLEMAEETVIGKFNWVSGLRRDQTGFFLDQPERSSHLILRKGAVITHRHIIDCSDAVELDEMAALGGWASQIITHGVDIVTNRQRCGPVRIGRAAYVATHVVIIKDAVVPDYCAIGAGSLFRSRNEKPYGLYSGVPAVRVRELDPESLFFHREHSLII